MDIVRIYWTFGRVWRWRLTLTYFNSITRLITALTQRWLWRLVLRYVHTWHLRLRLRQRHHQSLTLHQWKHKRTEWVWTHSWRFTLTQCWTLTQTQTQTQTQTLKKKVWTDHKRTLSRKSVSSQEPDDKSDTIRTQLLCNYLYSFFMEVTVSHLS